LPRRGGEAGKALGVFSTGGFLLSPSRRNFDQARGGKPDRKNAPRSALEKPERATTSAQAKPFHPLKDDAKI
jgi:hypothetical protein